MKISNLYDVHPVVAKAICRQISRPHTDYIRVTELINPAQIRQLMLKHYDDIEVDISENLWALFGTGLHGVTLIEPGYGRACEVGLTMEVDGTRINGTTDMIEFNSGIVDLKVTSVWRAVYGDWSDYALQLNIYRLMALDMGITGLDRLTNVCMLKDWYSHKAKDESYPKCPVVTVNQKVLDDKDVYRVMKERVQLHKQAETETVPCTWDEMSFHAKDTYKVKVKGKARSLANFDNMEDAQAKSASVAGSYVETVKAEPKRCLMYCPVRAFCKQGQAACSKVTNKESEE